MADLTIGGLGAQAFALTDLLPHEPLAGPPARKGDINALATLLNSLYVQKIGDTMTGKLIITQATANTSILTSTGYSLTAANAQNMLDFAGTWNTSGNPTALKIAITNTASGATSKFLEFLGDTTGALSLFSVSKAGIVISGGVGTTAFPGEFRTMQDDGANYISLKSVSPKSGLFRVGLDHFLFYNTATGDTTMDCVFGGAKLNFAISGSLKWQVSNAGHFLATTDNAVDIGASAATRPRNIFIAGGITVGSVAALVTTSAALTDASGAGAGTISNAPSAGNPTKWIQINDNGTVRKIPTWT